MADSPNVKPGRRDAVLWALGQLERRMGPDWLERYWESAGHVPEEVNLGSGHVAAFGNLLDLALRYQVLDGAPGIGQVQREMRNDLRDERRWHSALQLEVAALGVRAGFTAALEAQTVGRGSPSDVIMRRDGRLLQAETFVVLRDERSREAAQYWDWLMAQIRNIGWRSGTGVSGDLGERLAHDVSAELLRLIETAAQAAVDTGEEQTVEFQTARLRVLPPGSTTYQLRGGIEEGKGWPRIEAKLVQKARQASSAGGGWLRADVRDGMWQFTPWARAGLRAQIEEIARLIRPVLGQVRGIEGVVLSSGALLAQGEFYGESAATEDGVLRTPAGAARAIFWVQGDHDAGGAGRHREIVGPAPGEHQAVRRVDLDELAGRLDAVSHEDAVAAAWRRLQPCVCAHPLDIADGVGEVGKHRLGLGGDMHTDLDHTVTGHDRSLARCSASARSLTRLRPRRQ
jgi:hypothetical protein